MLKRIVIYSMVGMFVLMVTAFAAGLVVKRVNTGRIAPGVMLCGRDVSGMTMDEAEQLMEELVPEFVTEARCRFLPEMRGAVEDKVTELNRTTAGMHLTVREKEVVLMSNVAPMHFLSEDTLTEVAKKSNEVKVWEWLYAKVAGHPLRIRQAEPVLVWEEEQFGEWIRVLEKLTEQDVVDATVGWSNGKIQVSESRRGFRLESEALWADAERVEQEVTEYLKNGSAEGLVLRFYVKGTAQMPNLSTSQAQKCDTVIGTFRTSYVGAGTGRAQNIRAGAEHLQAKVILPGDLFSVAEALMPFTEENGYATGGTYIDGQLSESIGGGVCQLSTTLYNALLQTRLEIVERYPHSMPVGYIPPGRDAAIAGDYKDLKFKNTTKAPVLLLCETTGEEVKVTLYGCEEARREGVTFENVVTEETEENVTVEVYRMETGENGNRVRERVSCDTYRVRKEE